MLPTVTNALPQTNTCVCGFNWPDDDLKANPNHVVFKAFSYYTSYNIFCLLR